MVQILEEFKEYIINGIIAAISAIFAYFMGKREQDANIKQAEGTALETIQSVYDKFASDTKGKIDELTSEIVKLTGKVKELGKEVKTLEKDLEDCRKINNLNQTNEQDY